MRAITHGSASGSGIALGASAGSESEADEAEEVDAEDITGGSRIAAGSSSGSLGGAGVSGTDEAAGAIMDSTSRSRPSEALVARHSFCETRKDAPRGKLSSAAPTLATSMGTIPKLACANRLYAAITSGRELVVSLTSR